MKDLLAGIATVILVVAGLIGLAFLAPYVQLQVMRMYGTELESVKTDIYRENKSYIEGTIRDLRQLHVEYLSAEEEHKTALRDLILHRAGELDWDRLPSDVRQFLNELRNSK